MWQGSRDPRGPGAESSTEATSCEWTELRYKTSLASILVLHPHEQECATEPSLCRWDIEDSAEAYFGIKMLNEIEVERTFKKFFSRHHPIVASDFVITSQYGGASGRLELGSPRPPKHLHHLKVRIFLRPIPGPGHGSLDDDEIAR